MSLIFIVLLVLIVDQAAKLLVIKFLSLNQPVPVIDSVLYFTYVKNPGAAFGILPQQRILFYVVTFSVLTILILFYLMTYPRIRMLTISFGSIIGGALGNLLDRIFRGQVVDFIDFRFWPVFNIADIAVVGGFALFAFLLIWPRKDQEKVSEQDVGEG